MARKCDKCYKDAIESCTSQPKFEYSCIKYGCAEHLCPCKNGIKEDLRTIKESNGTQA